jgi:hypothetical protein
MIKNKVKYLKQTVKWLLFVVLNVLAKQGNKLAHDLACELLPY